MPSLCPAIPSFLSLLDNNPHPHPPKAFTLFPRLPSELRLQIWTLSLPGPRLVEVRHYRHTKYQNPYQNAIYTSLCAPPSGLQVCRESRAVVLKYYKFCEGEEVKIWADPRIDTLYFGSCTKGGDLIGFVREAKMEDLAALRSLVVNERDLAYWRYRPRTTFRRGGGAVKGTGLRGGEKPDVFTMMSSLKRLIIAVQVDIDGDVDNPYLRSDSWDGWQFGGGAMTEDERVASTNERNWIFSAYSLGGHVFHVPGMPTAGSFSLDAPFRTRGLGDVRELEYYCETERRNVNTEGVRRVKKVQRGGRKVRKEVKKMRERGNVRVWYRKVLERMPGLDWRVKRLFLMHRRYYDTNIEEGTDAKPWWPPQVAVVVRPSGTLISWTYCLEQVLQLQWPGAPDLRRWAVRGRVDADGDGDDERD
jgi:hypothetical protein